ncbi:sigma-54-dependent transcriptional regulator [Pseudopedobacter beijingensis]|uniref:Sigma-54-dependent transcriptional regulator n=1 Tax=Pseudopedobacter beijingensis TaxID=1207056 RepID=A0ABW4I9P7_9SPHI
MKKILIVEDDSTFAQLLDGFLTKNNFATTVANSVKSGLLHLEKDSFDLLLLDYRLPDGIGLDILLKIRAHNNHVPAIIMTSFNDVRTAVNAMRSGAFDYITKPVNPDELLMIIGNALDKKQEVKKQATETVEFIKGESIESEKLYKYVDLVAPTDMSVLINGESGTGKEHIAKTIHLKSNRKDKPFIAIDCGALSKELAASELFGHIKGAFTGALTDKKGQFEAANGGTLFLDEVGNLSYDVQVKLLRTLQEKTIQPVGSTKILKVDVRIITATNDDLNDSVKNENFREDLYHRINEFKILMPPLRSRGKDLELFIDHFVATSNKELGRNVKHISPEAKAILLKYDWPGNLRELKNVIKRMVLLTQGEVADIYALPEEMTESMNLSGSTKTDTSNITGLKEINEVNEKALIIETLEKVRYNKSKAAKMLNIDRKTLYNKMDRYGIE